MYSMVRLHTNPKPERKPPKMARPKQTLEEKLDIYQTKYRNAVQEIKLKDAEIDRLRALAETFREKVETAQAQADRAMTLAEEMQRARETDWKEYRAKLAKAEGRGRYDGTDQTERTADPRRKCWKTRRRHFR